MWAVPYVVIVIQAALIAYLVRTLVHQQRTVFAALIARTATQFAAAETVLNPKTEKPEPIRDDRNIEPIGVV